MTNQEAIEVLRHLLDVECLVTEDEGFEHYEGDKKPGQAFAMAITILERVEKFFEIVNRKKDNDEFTLPEWNTTKDIYNFFRTGEEW